MTRVLVLLVAGTVLSGLAAAYASTIPRTATDSAPIKAELSDSPKLAAS
jgi:hypothetical protein